MVKKYLLTLSIVLSILCLLSSTKVIANDQYLDIDETIVTGTRSKEKVKYLPVKIEIIDAKEIEMTTGETIIEQLKKSSSVDISEDSIGLAGIGIRGFKPEYSGISKHSYMLRKAGYYSINKHSAILIDGRPSGVTNLATILVDNVERIEVLKGPASSLYGAEAMGGVINVITKKNTGDLTGTGELGYASYNTFITKGALGGKINNFFDFDISARKYDQRDDFTTGNGDKRANSKYMTNNGNFRLGANLGENLRVDLGFDAYQGRDIEIPVDIFDKWDKPTSKDIDRYGFDLNIEGQILNHLLSFTGYKTQELTKNYAHYKNESEINYIGFQVKDIMTLDDHKLIFGVDYQDIDKISRMYDIQNGNRFAPESPDESRKTTAAYLETIWAFMDKRMTITAGGRYDKFDIATEPTAFKKYFTPKTESFSAFSPRAGVNYLFNPNIRLHTTIGKAFVPPTAVQLTTDCSQRGPGVIIRLIGNPDLDPETSVTYDVGLGYFKKALGLSADITYFHTDINNIIVTQKTASPFPVISNTFQNAMEAEIQGMEYMFSYDVGIPLKWDCSLKFFFNGTNILKAEKKLKSGYYEKINNVASHTYNYGINYSNKMFDARLHIRKRGSVNIIDMNSYYSKIRNPGFTVVDFVFGMTFLDNHKITLKIDNLLDKNYYEERGYPKPGRGFFLSYRYAF